MDISKIQIAIVLFVIGKYYNIVKSIITPFEKSKQKYSSNQCILKQKSVETMSHKEILLKLYEAADKCYMKVYALRCIRLTNYCPYLINIPHGPDGYTPFHKVCFHGNTCLIEYMLAKGANPFLTTYTGENAICMALYFFLNHPNNNDFTCLDILCETGCHLDISNIHYDIFLKAALNNHNKLLTEWILVHNKINTLSRSYSEP
ncbi:hypothetical protein V1477_005041 [Vespula maculifrons]|uniref:Uncharacterized protein n=2 Tax=Vespula TaxID=7451 RepID=A0ABD2CNS1_VESMC